MATEAGSRRYFAALEKELDKIEGELGVVACKIRVTLNFAATAGENTKVVLGFQDPTPQAMSKLAVKLPPTKAIQ